MSSQWTGLHCFQVRTFLHLGLGFRSWLHHSPFPALCSLLLCMTVKCVASRLCISSRLIPLLSIPSPPLALLCLALLPLPSPCLLLTTTHANEGETDDGLIESFFFFFSFSFGFPFLFLYFFFTFLSFCLFG